MQVEQVWKQMLTRTLCARCGKFFQLLTKTPLSSWAIDLLLIMTFALMQMRHFSVQFTKEPESTDSESKCSFCKVCDESIIHFLLSYAAISFSPFHLFNDCSLGLRSTTCLVMISSSTLWRVEYEFLPIIGTPCSTFPSLAGGKLYPGQSRLMICQTMTRLSWRCTWVHETSVWQSG